MKEQSIVYLVPKPLPSVKQEQKVSLVQIMQLLYKWRVAKFHRLLINNYNNVNILMVGRSTPYSQLIHKLLGFRGGDPAEIGRGVCFLGSLEVYLCRWILPRKF